MSFHASLPNRQATREGLEAAVAAAEEGVPDLEGRVDDLEEAVDDPDTGLAGRVERLEAVPDSWARYERFVENGIAANAQQVVTFAGAVEHHGDDIALDGSGWLLLEDGGLYAITIWARVTPDTPNTKAITGAELGTSIPGLSGIPFTNLAAIYGADKRWTATCHATFRAHGSPEPSINIVAATSGDDTWGYYVVATVQRIG